MLLAPEVHSQTKGCTSFVILKNFITEFSYEKHHRVSRSCWRILGWQKSRYSTALTGEPDEFYIAAASCYHYWASSLGFPNRRPAGAQDGPGHKKQWCIAALGTKTKLTESCSAMSNRRPAGPQSGPGHKTVVQSSPGHKGQIERLLLCNG